jgi:hypothetical protein
MHEQLADRFHLEIQFRHAPNLAVGQRFHAGTTDRLAFLHAGVCARMPDLTSQIAMQFVLASAPFGD